MILISGGALGADSLWSYYGDQLGIKTYHLIADGVKRPSGGSDSDRAEEQSSGIDVQVQPDNTEFAIQKLIELGIVISGKPPKEFFKLRGSSRSPAQNLQARNYFQVERGQQTLAICELKNGVPIGGTATAVKVSIKLEHPTYVLNTIDCCWYKYDFTKKTFIKSDKPKLMDKNTCIGTRNLVPHSTYKNGSWVAAPYVGAETENKIREMIQNVLKG